MWNLKKKYSTVVNVTERRGLTDIENKPLVTRGDRLGEEQDRGRGVRPLINCFM